MTIQRMFIPNIWNYKGNLFFLLWIGGVSAQIGMKDEPIVLRQKVAEYEMKDAPSKSYGDNNDKVETKLKINYKF